MQSKSSLREPLISSAQVIDCLCETCGLCGSSSEVGANTSRAGKDNLVAQRGLWGTIFVQKNFLVIERLLLVLRVDLEIVCVGPARPAEEGALQEVLGRLLT